MTGTSPALVSYGNAVTAMKALPATNPLSWTYQAAIHGSPPGPPPKPAWNTCEHGSLEFLSWHRMYLYWFERIIRKQSGDPNFALPFWNYEPSTERSLPVPFRTPGTGLFVPDVNRGSGWNAGSALLPASAVSTSGCLPQLVYSSFSGSLELTPHAAVHNTFGSTGGWMGSVQTAAQDPIFYLHHCNIDRLWNVWLAQGGGRSDPLSDTTWTKKKYLFFDENGAEVWMTGCDILRARDQLGYSYDGEPAQVEEFCLKRVLWWRWNYARLLPWPPFRIPPGPNPGPIELSVSAIRERLMRAAEDKQAEVVLRLSQVVANRQPNVYWEVYVGLRKGQAAVTESPAYVGNLAIFGAGVVGHEHGRLSGAQIDLTIDRAVQAALARDNGETLSLHFVAKGAELKESRDMRNNVTVTIGRAELLERRLEEVRQ
jgi:tyrosinase